MRADGSRAQKKNGALRRRSGKIGSIPLPSVVPAMTFDSPGGS